MLTRSGYLVRLCLSLGFTFGMMDNPYKSKIPPLKNVSIPLNRVLETKYNTLCSRQNPSHSIMDMDQSYFHDKLEVIYVFANIPYLLTAHRSHKLGGHNCQ